MPDYTTNHEFQLFSDDESPWEHRTDFEALDTAVEIRDVEDNLDDYSPKTRAKFFATDSRASYFGNGNQWVEITHKPTQDHIDDTANPHEVTASQAGAPSQSEFDDHAGDSSNPHEVTSAQVSAPSQTEFDNHTGDTSNPHEVTASQANALSSSGGTVTGDTEIQGATTHGNGSIHQQRGAPTTSELADGERMTYVSDGSDAHSAGDLVSARNDAGTIVSQVLAAAADDA